MFYAMALIYTLNIAYKKDFLYEMSSYDKSDLYISYF